MYCKNCGKQINDQARFCVHCGSPVIQEYKAPTPKNSKLPVIIAIVALLVTSVLGYVAFNTGSNKGSTSDSKEESSYTINEEGNILFGTYEGQEIEWIVLDEKEDGSKLLLSKNILLRKEYNEEYTEVTWETCTLRNWLNNDFYKEAFSTFERFQIQTTKVVNNDNEEYGIEGGNDTEDKIFLLSIDEANQYFKSDKERIAQETDKCISWYYWLRSPGKFTDDGACVIDTGSVFDKGSNVGDDHCGVRPALWAKLNINSNKGNTTEEKNEVDSANTITEERIILFGTYEGQKIEWIVLEEKEDGSKLLLSKYILLEKAYNDEFTSVTWETCTLRTWLNNDFYKEAFNTFEQSKIQTTKVVNKDNERYGTIGGKDTEDKIFLLSIDEANQYFNSDEERIAKELDNSSWYYWLRSPGYDTCGAADVYSDGHVYEDGIDVASDGDGVRPALWVNL